MSFADIAEEFEHNPGSRSLSALREAILDSPTYRPEADADAATKQARAADAPEQVISTIQAMMPGCHLSPMAHGLLTEAHAALGDQIAADREQALTTLAFRSILDSGDGSPEHPWIVLRISDEYDVLRLLRRDSSQQSYVERGGRRLDRHEHSDGTESWFDVSLLPQAGPHPAPKAFQPDSSG